MIEVILQGESVMDFEKVKEIIVETLSCDADKVTPDARLAEDLEADSLAAVELSMALEEEFGVTIADLWK